MYNIGVRPTAEDSIRGGNDGFGWPLALASLMLKNVGGTAMIPGGTLSNFDPDGDASCAPNCRTGALFPRTAQDPRINPVPRLRHAAPATTRSVGRTATSYEHPKIGEIAVDQHAHERAEPGCYLECWVINRVRPQQQFNNGDGPCGHGPQINRVARTGCERPGCALDSRILPQRRQAQLRRS